jgi:ectoine hydroxylase-related dioxygenase (phytanoyl-CoA dioxygenase family)
MRQIPPADAPPTTAAPAAAAAGGLHLDSGLWLDRLDWRERIAERRSAGSLTAEQAERLARFAEHGFVVIDLEAGAETFAGFEADVDRVWREKPADLAYASGGPARRFPTADEARDRRHGSRIHDLHSHSGPALDLYLHPLVHETARLILGDDAVAIQSLYFQFGSEQILHRDPVVVPTGAPLRLLAAWIALEDIHPDSGALVYVPESHRLPYYEFAPGVYEFDGRTMGAAEAAAATAFDDEQARRHGLEPELFTPRRGQTLIWHASLRHGGSPVRDPERTRKSFVVHFSTAGTYPRRSITVAEARPEGGDDYVVWETERLVERGDRRGFENPLRGRRAG